MTKNCSNCRYWGSGAEVEEFRTCLVISHDGDSENTIIDSSEGIDFLTRSDFGCISHKEFPIDNEWLLWRSFEGKPDPLILLLLADIYEDNNDSERSCLCRLMSDNIKQFRSPYTNYFCWTDFRGVTMRNLFDELFALKEPYRTQVITGNFSR